MEKLLFGSIVCLGLGVGCSGDQSNSGLENYSAICGTKYEDNGIQCQIQEEIGCNTNVDCNPLSTTRCSEWDGKKGICSTCLTGKKADSFLSDSPYAGDVSSLSFANSA